MVTEPRPQGQFDLTRLQRAERMERIGEIVRFAILVPACILVTLEQQTWLFAALYSAFAVTSILWFVSLARMPEKVGLWSVVWIALMALLKAGSMAVLLIALYWRKDPVFDVLVLLSVGALAVNTAAHRAEHLLTAIAFALSILTVLCAVLLRSLMTGASLAEIVALCSIAGVFVFMMCDAIRDQSRLRGRIRSAERADLSRERLQSLGHLAGGVAHDFNNLLTVILGNLDLRHEVKSDAERETLMAETEAAAYRAVDLTGQLLSYTRAPGGHGAPEAREVGALVQGVEAMLLRLLPATHRLQVQQAPELPRIAVDRTAFQTVLVNLIVNARDALPDGGEIMLTLEEQALPNDSSETVLPDLPEGSYVVATVADGGEGIPADLIAKVMEPYFTTKPEGKGSGLGLPMALSFARETGGALQIDSAPGQGTKVRLWVPAAQPAQVLSYDQSRARS